MAEGISRLTESVWSTVEDPTIVICIYEEFINDKRPDLPPKFFCGSEGLCRAMVILCNECMNIGMDIKDIDGEKIKNMRLGPIMEKFGDLDTMLFLFGEMIPEP